MNFTSGIARCSAASVSKIPDVMIIEMNNAKNA